MSIHLIHDTIFYEVKDNPRPSLISAHDLRST